MRLDEYIKSNRDTDYVLDESISQWATKAASLLNMVVNKSSREFTKLCQDYWGRLVDILHSYQLEQDALKIINKRLGANFRSLDQISNTSIKKIPMKEDVDMISEDISHWWQVVKDNAFPSLTIFAALQICFELDKLLSNAKDFGLEKIILYGSMWVFLISGYYIKSWYKWKKENPEEYKAEKEKRKSGEEPWRSKSLKSVRSSKILS
jgi:hypothetical protein